MLLTKWQKEEYEIKKYVHDKLHREKFKNKYAFCFQLSFSKKINDHLIVMYYLRNHI